MPDTNKLKTLINRLNALSEADKVPWSETSNENVFQASFWLAGMMLVTLAIA
jgi:hypothetical protein